MSKGGKKRGAQPRQSGGGGGGGTHWKWLLAGVALGLLVAFGVYLLKILPTAMEIRAKEKSAAAACEPAGDKAAKPGDAADGKPASDKPIRIDFYDMLPKQQVVVPAAGGKTTVATPPPAPVNPQPAPVAPAPATVTAPANPASPATATAPATPATAAAAKPAAPAAAATGPRYLLQAGSFKTRTEADHRRAGLTLSGYDVSVQEAKNAKGETWFRVMVGPFAGEAAMQKAKQALASRKVDTLPVRVK